MSSRVALLADNLHINRKNFNLLLSFLSARGVTLRVTDSYPLSITANGLYEDKDFDNDAFNRRLMFSQLSVQELLEMESHGINLFDMCRADTLSYLLPINRQPEEPLPMGRLQLLEWILDLEADALYNNMVAAEIWINYWWQILERSRVNYVLVFSGSSIYARALLEVSTFFIGRTFVLESFFTGTHFYCEERFSPIANNSDLRLDSLNTRLNNDENKEDFELNRNAMTNIMASRSNKNVKQPLPEEGRLFQGSQKNLLILGQVVNDFSLIEYKSNGLNSLAFYLQVIEEALSCTDMNIIFKAHPWERQKFNVNKPHTFTFLTERYANNPRVVILEQFSLNELFQQSDCVITLNSQSGIEAAWEGGFRPLQAGNAFWGGKGFSVDSDLYDRTSLSEYLKNPEAWTLSLDAFKKVEMFLINSLRKWLIPEKGNAEKILETIFYELPKNSASVTTQQQKVKLSEKIKRIQSHSWQKLKKLFKHPHLFLRDSRYKLLRTVGERLYYRTGK